MSAAVAFPKHQLFESPNSRAIEIGSWTITARTNPISNAGQSDALQAAIGGIPLPEMTFGSNSLELKHKESGWKYAFTTEEALKGVRNGELQDGDGGVKVGYADAWLKSRYDMVLFTVDGHTVLIRAAVLVLLLKYRCPRPSRLNRSTGHIPLSIRGIAPHLQAMSNGNLRSETTRLTVFQWLS